MWQPAAIVMEEEVARVIRRARELSAYEESSYQPTHGHDHHTLAARMVCELLTLTSPDNLAKLKDKYTAAEPSSLDPVYAKRWLALRDSHLQSVKSIEQQMKQYMEEQDKVLPVRRFYHAAIADFYDLFQGHLPSVRLMMRANGFCKNAQDEINNEMEIRCKLLADPSNNLVD
jgi:hypothetical protein